MTHRVVIDCDCRRVTTYTLDGTCVAFQGISMMLDPEPCTNRSGTDN